LSLVSLTRLFRNELGLLILEKQLTFVNNDKEQQNTNFTLYVISGGTSNRFPVKT
jgi:hypothetical protein